MKDKQDIIKWIESNRQDFIKISDEIWANPEMAFEEFIASKLQADYLQAQGFKITWDIGDIETAFIAEWGEGKPVIGFAGEYDALLNLSQKNQPDPEPIVAGAPGHGCGHNLLGVGCMASAVAVKEWLQANGKKGTVRYYGCPAEEQGNGKALMARAGAFDDLDAAFNYHPSKATFASKGSCVAVDDVHFRFHGKSAHAGGTPHLGRSALDAVELMTIGVNFLREHVTEKVRMHYVITKGGDLPNIVPAEAEVWFFLRAPERDEVEDVTRRVRLIAQGAAMMTETTFEEDYHPGALNVINNHYLADLQYKAMQEIGPITYTSEELEYAHKINAHFDIANIEELIKEYKMPEKYRKLPIIGDNLPSIDEGKIDTGSTDVGNMSWLVPVSMLNVTCWALAAPGHSWANTATGAMSIGHKGMLHAAKIMALAAIDLYDDPKHIQQVRQEFDAQMAGRTYPELIPASYKPPRKRRQN